MTIPRSLVILVPAAMVGLSTAGLTQDYLTNGLLDYYPLNGNFTNEVRSGCSGTTRDGIAWTADRFGLQGHALDCGPQAKGINLDECLGPTGGQYSLSFWLKVPAFGGWVDLPFYELPTQGFSIRVRRLGGSPVGPVVITVRQSNNGERSIDYRGDWFGDWFHFVLSVESPRIAAFVNGELVAPASDTAPNRADLLTNLQPETAFLGSSGFFCGYLDDVRRYGRALSEHDVKSLFQYESIDWSKSTRRASAVAQVSDGCIVAVSIIDSGYGYTNGPAPVVVIRGSGGMDAVAHAIVEAGRVIGVVVDNPGRGYTVSANVIIAPPAFAPRLSVSVSRVKLRMSVVLGRSYVLNTSSDMMNWDRLGDPFIAQEDVVVQEVDVSPVISFFRIQEVP